MTCMVKLLHPQVLISIITFLHTCNLHNISEIRTKRHNAPYPGTVMITSLTSFSTIFYECVVVQIGLYQQGPQGRN